MRCGLPVLLIVYVALDFANPLMPGAVRFDRGAVWSVEADRPARPDASRPVLAPRACPGAPVSSGIARADRPAPPRAAMRPWHRVPLRAPRGALPPPSPSTDDH